MNTKKHDMLRKTLLLVSVFIITAGTSYANITNQIPYTEDFESVASGSALVGTRGWYGGSNTYAIVTNIDYSALYSNYPLPGSTHSNVMQLQTEGTTITNQLEDYKNENNVSHTTNIWFDSVIQFTHWAEDYYPESITSNNQAQCAFFVNTNNHLVLYHYDFVGTSNTFSEISSTSITNGQYSRITIVMDYLSDAIIPGTLINHAYYKVYIDDDPVTNTAAYQSPSASSGMTGTWFMCANDGVATKYITEMTFSGNGVFDDMVVTTNDPYSGPPPVTYTISTEMNDPARGNISPASDTVTEGSDSTDFSITASNGYYVAQLLTNSVQVFTNSNTSLTSTNYTWPTVMADGTVTVNFATSPTYLVTGIVATGNGTIDPISTNVAAATDASFQINGNPGWYVQSITTNGTAIPGSPFGVDMTSTNYTWQNIVEPGTVSVSFAEYHVVTGQTSGVSGSITPASRTVVDNANADFSISADSGSYIRAIQTNAVAIPGSPFGVDLTSTNFTWANVVADGTVSVQFAEWHVVTGVVATGNGTITPESRIVGDGQNASFNLVAASHYHVGLLETNGTATGGPWDNTSTNENYVWSSVLADGTVSVTFAENVWTNDTPETWLDTFYGSTNYDEAASSDTDGDGQAAWEEYLAGTDPTSSSSLFRIENTWHENGTNYLKWVSYHVGDQTSLPPYNVVYATNMLNANWTAVTDTVERTDGTYTNIWSWESMQGAFYRIVATNSAE